MQKKLSRVRIVLGGLYPGGSCPGGNCPGWDLSSGNCPSGNCPGANCPRTLKLLSPALSSLCLLKRVLCINYSRVITLTVVFFTNCSYII